MEAKKTGEWHDLKKYTYIHIFAITSWRVGQLSGGKANGTNFEEIFCGSKQIRSQLYSIPSTKHIRFSHFSGVEAVALFLLLHITKRNAKWLFLM